MKFNHRLNFLQKSKGIFSIRFISIFLNEYKICNGLYLGWGRKKSFFKAQALAEQKGLKALCLEDGFIRSLGLGKDGYQPLSLVVDEVGIYFDALQPSDLESIILKAEIDEQNCRAEKAIAKILKHGITKYNQKFKTLDSEKFAKEKRHILVIDQTFGDQSIRYAGANAETFKTMLKQACHNHPEAVVWVKTHPDVLAGKAKAHFSTEDLNHQNIQVITENYNPIELVQFMDEVYVVSSQLGFEALLCQKKVHCFGVPWYAGWGLTDDQYAPLNILNGRRGVQRSLHHLFASAYFYYARYVNPITGKHCECEDMINLLIPNIEFQKRVDQSYVAYGFSPWKKKFISDFFSFPKLNLKFQRYLKPKKNQAVLAWGKKAHELNQQGYTDIITVEDGFIRSIGLGAKLIRPCSLVFDDVGIYYDATKPSLLENLLQQRTALTDQERERAQNLRHLLVDLNITKYNVGNKKELHKPEGYDKVILVVGQVEDDMSIQLGGVQIKTNLSLLQCVRKNNPNSYIVFKPHPDVQAGLRIGKISEEIIFQYANYLELERSILQCFHICDELHTITSLSGFEALLRGITVYCYGLPFYSGWGLTIDYESCSRRTRKIDIDYLVFVTLIEYAVYNMPGSEKGNVPLVSVETLIHYLQQKMNTQHNSSISLWKHILNAMRVLKNK